MYLLFLLAFVSPTLAAIYASFSELKNGSAYDFVVIGAGPGGSTVANRLTEDANTTVLMLEAGGANDGVINIDVPLLCTTLTPQTQWDWNYSTVPQAALNGRTIPYPRGIGLGGTSAVNCLVYTRGSSDDIDRWAALSNDSNWSWDAMLPYFMKSEKFNFPVDGHNITGQFDPSVHGFDGFIGVSVPGASRAIDGRVMETAESEDKFPFRVDMNAGEPIGIGYTQALIDEGVRSSSKAYLTPEVLNRTNLDILLNTKVSRLLQTSTDGYVPEFKAVEFLDAEDGQLRSISVTKEIILSAGTVANPGILMRSGIGNATFLSSLSITPLVDLPSVGQNLTDHVGVSIDWVVNSTLTYDSVLRNVTLMQDLLSEWETNKTGIMVDTSENHVGFLRIPDNATVFDNFTDPSSGSRTPHYEFLFQNGLSTLTPAGNFLHLPVGCVTPASKGSIIINSTDPFSPPLIDPGVFTAPVDISILRYGVRSMLSFVSSPAWADYLLEPSSTANPFINGTNISDNDLDEYIRNNAVSFFHPVSTASMSPFDAEWGVVDPDLRVKKVLGVRIVDASVLPSLPAAHTSAAVYGVAERAADLIKTSWS